MTDTTDRIRQFILTTYLPGESAANLPDDLALRTSGILDSLATLGVVRFVEQEFGVELEASDTSVDNFNTIAAIAALVARKRGQ